MLIFIELHYLSSQKNFHYFFRFCYFIMTITLSIFSFFTLWTYDSFSPTSTYIIFNSLTRFLWWILINKRSIHLIIARTPSCIRSTGLSIRLIVTWTLSWIRTSWLSACLIIDRTLSYISSSLRLIYLLLFFLSFWS